MRSSTMALYTILLDYAGGTYVAQTKAMSEGEALDSWIAKLGSGGIGEGPSVEVANAFQDLGAGRPRPLEGVTSVWCSSAVGKQGLALVNIVKTSAEA